MNYMLKKTFVLCGIVAPLLVIVYLLSGHGSFEDVMLYSPTWRKMLIALLFPLFAGLSLAADTLRKKTFSLQTVILAGLSFLLTVYLVLYFIVPAFIRVTGETPHNFLASDAQTAPVFRFAAAGDPHIGDPTSHTERTLHMLNIIKNEKYSAFFLLGDLVDHGFNGKLWQKALQAIAGLEQTVPFCHIPGNHDMMFGGDALYRRYARPKTQTKLWRRIDRGNVHFLILDIEWCTQTYTPEQARWLQAELASIPRQDWCIVLTHTFFYCSGLRKHGWDWSDNTKLIAKICPLFERYGVDLVMSGHSHQAEILQKNGVTYVVMGTFGGPLGKPALKTSTASLWYKPQQHAFAEVILKEKTGILNVRDPENKILYSFNFRKR